MVPRLVCVLMIASSASVAAFVPRCSTAPPRGRHTLTRRRASAGPDEDIPDPMSMSDEEIYASLKSRISALGGVSIDSEEDEEGMGYKKEQPDATLRPRANRTKQQEEDEDLPFFPVPSGRGRRRSRDDMDRLRKIQGIMPPLDAALQGGEVPPSPRDIMALNTIKSLGLVSSGLLVLTLLFQASLGDMFIHTRGLPDRTITTSKEASAGSKGRLEADLYDPQDAFLYETLVDGSEAGLSARN